MSELLKLILCIYVLTLIFSALVAFFKFIVDTRKWHDKEERIHITASQFEEDLKESSPDPVEAEPESEVKIDVSESR